MSKYVIDCAEAFEHLGRAWYRGRTIVPLLGAGVSVQAGIPTTAHLIEHLLRVRWHVESSDTENCAAHIARHGWPDRHEIMSRWISAGHPSLWPEAEPKPRWVKLLDDATDGNKPLKDLFFHQLVRDRFPASSHQYVAFLTQRLSLPLILTTNFDSLIEQALRAQGLRPTVFELTDEKEFPDPSLVIGDLSVVKLHGGAFNLIAGSSLDGIMDKNAQLRVISYLPHDSLLLILGYGGQDERVMSFIRTYVGCVPNMDGPNVLWIHRDDPPDVSRLMDDRAKDAPLRLCRYRDAGRFLQELYSSLVCSHPVSQTSYRSLAQMPSYSLAAESSETVINPSPARVFVGNNSGSGTSTSLARAAEALSLRHHIIWCDLEELPTLDSLINYLQNSIRRQDPHLPPFALFRPRLEATQVTDPRVFHLLDALQRDRYLIAIDSMGEFGTSYLTDFYYGNQAAITSECRRLLSEVAKLNSFLLELLKHQDEFGESKVYVAHTPLDVGRPDIDPDIHMEAQRLSKEFVDELLASETVSSDGQQSFLRGIAMPVAGELLTTDAIRALLPGTSAPLEDQVRIFWNGLKRGSHKLVTLIAAVFRRPRSLVALRRLAIPFLDRVKDREVVQWFFNAIERERAAILNLNVTPDQIDGLDRIVDDLCALGVLIRQEGGFYWMHPVVRDTLLACVLEDCGATPKRPLGPEQYPGVGCLHNLIALYYYHHLFVPSKDPAAFLEYVFHRVGSIHFSSKEVRNRRFQGLLRALRRHRDGILCQSDAHMLVAWVRHLRDFELENCYERLRLEPDSKTKDEFLTLRQEARSLLCDLEGEVLRQSLDLVECCDLRLRQIQDRIAESPRLLSSDVRSWNEVLEETRGKLAKSDMMLTRGPLTDPDRSLLRTLKQIVGRKASVQCQSSNVDIATSGFRLIDHILDVAVCMHHARAPMSITEDVLGAISDMMREIEAEVIPAMRAHARRALIRCSFRLMGVCLDQISPWRRPERKSFEKLIRRVKREFDDGNALLELYPGVEDRDDLRYKCFVNCLMARAAYLEGQFVHAYDLLDAAIASVSPASRGSEKTALAVTLLHRAECLMLHADFLMVPHDIVSPAKVATSQLRSAATLLRQAEDLLTDGRPNMWWWCWLHLLRAQLEHEHVALCLDLACCANDAGQTHRRAPIEGCDVHVLAGLAAIRAGIEGACGDTRREEELRMLWWQLFLCDVFSENSIAGDVPEGEKSAYRWPKRRRWLERLSNWRKWNESHRSDQYFQQELAGLDAVVDEWADPERPGVQEMLFRQEEMAATQGKSLRRLLLAAEGVLLPPSFSGRVAVH